MTTFDALSVVGVSGSPGKTSRSRTLLDRALRALERLGARTRQLDLAALPADALLGRHQDPAVTDALAAVQSGRIIVVSTPVYRATYSGLLKVFFDLLPQEALAGKVALAIATGATPAHFLAIDHGLRPLLASVGALAVPTAVYGTDAQFRDGAPDTTLLDQIERAVAEAATLAGLVPALEG
jgi:FMN reductase